MSLEWWPDRTGVQLEMLLLALLCSLVIGFERQFRHKAAGIRTHCLVALGSCTFTLVSGFGFSSVLGTDVNLDPSRIAAQVVSGIGFLGAGVIFMRRNVVRGLTTAAGIWVSAAVGMACGAGMPVIAIALTVLHLLLLVVISPLAALIPTRDRHQLVTLTYLDGKGVLRDVLQRVGDMGSAFTIESTQTHRDVDPPTATIRLRFKGGPAVQDLAMAMSEIPGVRSVESRRVSWSDDGDED